MFEGRENFEGEGKIADLVSSLRRVDAPGDFDTHVRARIARGQNVSGTSWPTNLIRLGAPVVAAIVVAIGGYLVFTAINQGQNDASSVAEERPAIQTPVVAPPTLPSSNDSQAEERIIVKPSDEVMADKINAEPPDSVVRGEKDKMDANSNTGRPTGGSTDLAFRESKNILPRGLNPNAKPQANAKGVDPNARIPVASILGILGVKATWTSDGWRVDTVDANDIASRSGIRTGDIVEAINGQTVDKKTTFPAKFDGTSIRVRRDGASLLLDFKP